MKTKPTTRKIRRKRQTRGVVYLSHIPHGFYEEQIRGYLEQFGRVRRVRVKRSAKTGKSKGHAFIEFEKDEVAKIAAQSLDNYLMQKRLLKAKFISAKERPPHLFSGVDYTATKYPKLKNRLKTNRIKNTNKSKVKINIARNRSLQKVSKLQQKLSELGIDFKVPIKQIKS